MNTQTRSASSLSALGGWPGLHRRPHERFAQVQPEDIDTDALVARHVAIVEDAARWRRYHREPGIDVYASRQGESPVVVYKSVTLHGSSAEDIVARFDERLLEFYPRFTTRTDAWLAYRLEDCARVQVLRDSPDERVSVFRLHYAMPLVMRNREFLYLAVSKRVRQDRWVVAYHHVDSDRFALRPGYVRARVCSPGCEIIDVLPAGNVRLTHAVGNDLEGWISPRLFNTFMSRAFLGVGIHEARTLRRLIP